MIVHLFDSVEYVETNCYQHQLKIHLERSFIPRNEYVGIPMSYIGSLPKEGTLLSTVKIRNVYRDLDTFKRVVGDRKIFAYDQDPWESFVDGMTYPGGYFKIREALPNVEFVVGCKWWADHINEKGLRAHTCRMFPLPEYCNIGLPPEQRERSVSFRGQLHGYRKQAVDELVSTGTPVRTLPGVPYGDWLSWLRTQSFFIHTEVPNWRVDGTTIPARLQVVKDVEIAAQGCVVMCDARHREELEYWQMDRVPLIRTFESPKDCAVIVKEIEASPRGKRLEMQLASVEKIRSMNCFEDMVQILKTG